MILLVGCETGSGRVYRNSGTFGLQQSLNTLGAKTVLGTLWKIDGRHDTNYIKDFIKHWTFRGNPVVL